jgi:hypothetical protein
MQPDLFPLPHFSFISICTSSPHVLCPTSTQNLQDHPLSQETDIALKSCPPLKRYGLASLFWMLITIYIRQYLVFSRQFSNTNVYERILLHQSLHASHRERAYSCEDLTQCVKYLDPLTITLLHAILGQHCSYSLRLHSTIPCHI